MKIERREFFKKLGIGVGAFAVAPLMSKNQETFETEMDVLAAPNVPVTSWARTDYIITIDCLVERENVIDRIGWLIPKKELKKAALDVRGKDMPVTLMDNLGGNLVGIARIYYADGEGLRAIINMHKRDYRKYCNLCPGIGFDTKLRESRMKKHGYEVLRDVNVYIIGLGNENSDKGIKKLSEGIIS